MAKVMKICKACGKEYEACHTPNPGVFRWRDIACSPECAEKYIHDVMVARGEIAEEPMDAATVNDNESAPASNGDFNELADAMVQRKSSNEEPAIRNNRNRKNR